MENHALKINRRHENDASQAADRARTALAAGGRSPVTEFRPAEGARCKPGIPPLPPATVDPEAIVEKVRRGYHALASMGRQPG